MTGVTLSEQLLHSNSMASGNGRQDTGGDEDSLGNPGLGARESEVPRVGSKWGGELGHTLLSRETVAEEMLPRGPVQMVGEPYQRQECHRRSSCHKLVPAEAGWVFSFVKRQLVLFGLSVGPRDEGARVAATPPKTLKGTRLLKATGCG